MVNAERRGKRQALIRPSSKVVVKFLSVMQRHGMYISSSRHLLFSTTVIVRWVATGVYWTRSDITAMDAVALHPSLALTLRNI
jgi:ribosomal protein S8